MRDLDLETEVRMDVFDLTKRGVIGVGDASIFLWLCYRAHKVVEPHIAAGVWVGTLAEIGAVLCRGTRCSPKRSTRLLENAGLIKSFTLPGGRIAFVMHGVVVSRMGVALVVDAVSTTDWNHPVYLPYPEDKEVV